MTMKNVVRVAKAFMIAWVTFGVAGTAARAGAPPAQGNSGAGALTGKVSFSGAKPKLRAINMDQDPYCVNSLQGQKVYFEDGAVNADDTLPNVFIYVKQGLRNANYPAPKTPVILDQRGCMYVPHVLGVMVGQELRVMSTDLTTHNVHSTSKVNPPWNQTQTPGAPPIRKRYTKPEVMIPVKCNQHPWMSAYIGVVSNPFFAVTGTDGSFTIKGLPPGDYVIGAWTATFGTQEKSVHVSANETATLDFTFEGH